MSEVVMQQQPQQQQQQQDQQPQHPQQPQQQLETPAPQPATNQQPQPPAGGGGNQNAIVQAATDMCRNQSLRAREILASSNTPTAMLPLLQQGSFPIAIGGGFGTFPPQQQQQQGGPAPGAGGGQQPHHPQMADFNAFFGNFMGMPHHQAAPGNHFMQFAQPAQAGMPGGQPYMGHPQQGGAVMVQGNNGQQHQQPQQQQHAMNMHMPQNAMAQFNNRAGGMQVVPQQMMQMQGMRAPGGGGPNQQQQQRPAPTSQEVQDALATIAAATGTPMPRGGPHQGGGGQQPQFNMQQQGHHNQVQVEKSSVSHGAHPPKICYMECDEESLSDYQCLLRKQIELFEATPDDVQWNAQGRNKAIVLGQVGIRCRYCAQLPTWSRARGAVYYSATLDGLYQAAQNMAKNHLCRHCRLIPDNARAKLVTLRDCKRRAAGGKKYWAEGARVLGVIQTGDGGLRFKNSTIAGRSSSSNANPPPIPAPPQQKPEPPSASSDDALPVESNDDPPVESSDDAPTLPPPPTTVKEEGGTTPIPVSVVDAPPPPPVPTDADDSSPIASTEEVAPAVVGTDTAVDSEPLPVLPENAREI